MAIRALFDRLRRRPGPSASARGCGRVRRDARGCRLRARARRPRAPPRRAGSGARRRCSRGRGRAPWRGGEPRQKTSAMPRRVARLGRAGGGERLRAAHRGRHREELVRDVHQPEQERLLVLQPRLVDAHAVEARAREAARGALDEAQVRRQRPELARSAATGPSRASASDTTRRRTPASAASAASLAPSGLSGSISAPATCRCLSTASRAMNRCMISVEPSKIRLMR